MFGSRVNGKSRPDSDTDLLAIGPPDLRARLATFKPWPGFDIFVNVGGSGTFRSPWHRKAGSFKRWQCMRLSPVEATYMGSHPSRTGNPNESDSYPHRAVRLYPAPADGRDFSVARAGTAGLA
jgi:hypothetical protein